MRAAEARVLARVFPGTAGAPERDCGYQRRPRPGRRPPTRRAIQVNENITGNNNVHTPAEPAVLNDPLRNRGVAFTPA